MRRLRSDRPEALLTTAGVGGEPLRNPMRQTLPAGRCARADRDHAADQANKLPSPHPGPSDQNASV
jgi:hypothetical protein